MEPRTHPSPVWDPFLKVRLKFGPRTVPDWPSVSLRHALCLLQAPKAGMQALKELAEDGVPACSERAGVA